VIRRSAQIRWGSWSNKVPHAESCLSAGWLLYWLIFTGRPINTHTAVERNLLSIRAQRWVSVTNWQTWLNRQLTTPARISVWENGRRETLCFIAFSKLYARCCKVGMLHTDFDAAGSLLDPEYAGTAQHTNDEVMTSFINSWKSCSSANDRP